MCRESSLRANAVSRCGGAAGTGHRGPQRGTCGIRGSTGRAAPCYLRRGFGRHGRRGPRWARRNRRARCSRHDPGRGGLVVATPMRCSGDRGVLADQGVDYAITDSRHDPGRDVGDHPIAAAPWISWVYWHSSVVSHHTHTMCELNWIGTESPNRPKRSKGLPALLGQSDHRGRVVARLVPCWCSRARTRSAELGVGRAQQRS
jgi:hypothetical protein